MLENLSKKHLSFLYNFSRTIRHILISVSGPDAALSSMNSREDIQFIGYTESGGPDYAALVKLVKQQVKLLKHHEKCDMVIALLHGGLKDSEDLYLAGIEGVDLVIAGETTL